MKITSFKTDPLEPIQGPVEGLDLLQQPLTSRKPPRRKIKNSTGGVRLRKETAAGATAGRRIRPETPLLKWKFVPSEDGGEEEKETPSEDGRRTGRKVKAAMSARKVGAALWRMQLPEGTTNNSDDIGFQGGVNNAAFPFHGHHVCQAHISPNKDPVPSPRSNPHLKNGLSNKVEPVSQFSYSSMEGATKWDPIGLDVKQIYSHAKPVDHLAVISNLEAELEEARTRINELETEGRSSKKKMEHFLRKLSEERAAWRSREHEKVRAIIDDVKTDLNRERKHRQRQEIVNSKLVNELADMKFSAKRYMQDYEKERKARELIEEVCDELAKEIGEDKAEIEELKRETMRVREEVDEERKMLQMAEVWREERVQMKLVDAKIMLEDKYNEMNRLIVVLESFFDSFNGDEMKKAELLKQAVANLNIQDIQELTYEPPDPDDIFSVFEDGEPNERQIDSQSQASRASQIIKDKVQRHSNAAYDLEEDGSEWETVSQLEDQGSDYSSPSVNRSQRDSNVSRNGFEKEIRELANSVQNPQLKKASSISRLWRSTGGNNGENYKIVSLDGINGRLSNARLSSPEYGSGSPELSGQWGSPDTVNPHMRMKGCMEWPRSAQKHSLKAKLLEARMESQKVQLRQVLKHKI